METESQAMQTVVGTPLFPAPEMVSSRYERQPFGLLQIFFQIRTVTAPPPPPSPFYPQQDVIPFQPIILSLLTSYLCRYVSGPHPGGVTYGEGTTILISQPVNDRRETFLSRTTGTASYLSCAIKNEQFNYSMFYKQNN